MNAHRIYAAIPPVRRAMEHFAAFDGNIKKPLLSMHTIYDTLVTVDNESVYRVINQTAGREDLLMQVYTNGVGHCTFTQAQTFTVIQAMESWLNTGTKPDVSFFAASQGFVQGFQPPVWPQPIK